MRFSSSCGFQAIADRLRVAPVREAAHDLRRPECRSRVLGLAYVHPEDFAAQLEVAHFRCRSSPEPEVRELIIEGFPRRAARPIFLGPRSDWQERPRCAACA